ncbi:Transcriptional regulator, LysR family [Candidatus Burkholderia verschuerenii]|uniref:Transcriptional regulator, LysR family n=1 Tax=Candidatus Burkholderia verschuerenii TaxID=242163 RepID=A0A0L0MA49_9BURK|nr:Transcriptional regulator, LysR family [Candidatus Burkholderia verschuerenii]
MAEELHFGRAAERLHVDQSPLSRTIKELEEDLGTPLFVRTTRSTRLTRAGRLFLDHIPRVFVALEQARSSVRAAAAGYDGQLRIALSDGITPPRLSSLMALCRQEDPEIAIRFSEVPLAQQIRGLHDDLYDVGFAQSDHAGDGILVEPAWTDPLRVAIPARHPLLAHARIPLDELLRYPLVMCDAYLFEGYHRQIERLLRSVHAEPLIAERVSSFDLMMAIVSAGFALALVGASHIVGTRAPDVVGRPLASHDAMLTTYVLRRDTDPTDAVSRFIERVAALETDPVTPGMTASPHEDDQEASL